MFSDRHPDLDDPRYADAEAAMEAWRDVLHVHRRRLLLAAFALLAVMAVAVAFVI